MTKTMRNVCRTSISVPALLTNTSNFGGNIFKKLSTRSDKFWRFLEQLLRTFFVIAVGSWRDLDAIFAPDCRLFSVH